MLFFSCVLSLVLFVNSIIGETRGKGSKNPSKCTWKIPGNGGPICNSTGTDIQRNLKGWLGLVNIRDKDPYWLHTAGTF